MQVFVSVSAPSNLEAVLSLSTSFGGAVSNVESSGVTGKSEPVTPDQCGVLLFTQLFHTPRRDPRSPAETWERIINVFVWTLTS